MKLFVYGTLRKGGDFAQYLPDGREIKLCQLEGVRMYDLGYYPGCTITGKKEDVVVGEVNIFDDILFQEEWENLLARMDKIEGVVNGLFDRSTIETPYGEAVIYTVSDKTMKRVTNDKTFELQVLTDWAEVNKDVADMVPTLNKEKDNVTLRTKEQKE